MLALAVAIAGAGMLVLPEREKADQLDHEIAVARAKVAVARDFAQAYRPEALNSADLFRLSKAMPSGVGMPDLLLQLERVADSAGVALRTIVPRDEVRHEGYRAIPVDLTATGSFYSVSDFLLRLRSTVRARGNNLDVGGWLYSIDRFSLSSPARGGDLSANLTVSAFTFDGAPVVPGINGVAG